MAKHSNVPHSLARAHELAGANGIGRLDLVENRFIGMKSRGVYETPGGTVLLAAHRAMESITLDRGAMHLKDEIMPRYAELIYNGFWFSPERAMLQALIDFNKHSSLIRPQIRDVARIKAKHREEIERLKHDVTQTEKEAQTLADQAAELEAKRTELEVVATELRAKLNTDE